MEVSPLSREGEPLYPADYRLAFACSIFLYPQRYQWSLQRPPSSL